MMKKEVIISSIILLLLLPGVLGSSASENLQKGINEAAYHAEQYHKGNENYADYTANINEVENKINSALLQEGEGKINEKDIQQILGDANIETSWIPRADDEVKVDAPVAAWTNVPIFDGKQQVKLELTPTLSENNEVNYQLSFTTDFVQSRPLIDIKDEISKIENLAKEYALNTQDIQKANQLAETSVNLENLFKDYMAMSPGDSCEETMAELLGSETKTSQVEIIVKEYELSNKDGIRITARLEICEKCNNIDYFVNLKTRFEKNGNTLEYYLSMDNAKTFGGLDTTGIKRAMIDANQIFQELVSSGNYESSYEMMKRIESLNELWAEKTDNSDEKTKLENFLGRNRFLQSLFDGASVKTSSIEQTSYEKTFIQEFNDNSEEICTNELDDNNDQLIDCSDSLCSGKVCGTETVSITEENITTHEIREKYCTLGQCQFKEIPKAETSECGNNKCEDGENETCSQDCSNESMTTDGTMGEDNAIIEETVCAQYPSIECGGDLISSGEDANGCPLEPVCLKNKNSCSTSEDCVQPLCGKSECIQGTCQTTELNQCEEKLCFDGETKSDTCETGESILIERCVSGKWEVTGLKCETSVSGPKQIIKTLSNECKIASDCKEKGNQCVLGECKALTIKKEVISDLSPSSFKWVSGTSFTGESIRLTTEVLTGVVPDPTNPEVLGEPKDYKRPDSEETGSSFLTGVSRIEDTQTATSSSKSETSRANQNLIQASSNEKNIFAVHGYCVKDKNGETPIITFGGDGNKFETISSLQNSYEEDGSESYCKWKFENLLRERVELEKSFNYEFIQKYFEEDLPNFANNWENAHRAIIALHTQNVENQIETAKIMECLGIKRLDNYNLISIDYENELYGTLKYEESIKSVKFTEMSNDVDIISPSIKEFSISPSRNFIKSELIDNMENGIFPGSSKSSAERSINKGLTSTELEALRNNQKALNLIKKLSENSPDGNVDVQVKILDGEEVVYNVYVRINENEIAKAQPLTPEKTPNKNFEVTISFDEMYNILRDARKRTYSQDAPWEEGALSPISIVNTARDWIDTQLKLRSLIGSIKVTPSGNDNEIKDLFKEFFYVLGSGESTNANIITTAQRQIVYNSDGKATSILT